MQQNLNISNPFSTGGGGVSFERLVAAHYLVSTLKRDIPLGLPGGITASVRLQARQVGAPLDDILVVAEEGAVQHRLQIQVKHGMTFTEKSELLQEVIAAAWAAFRGKFGFQFDPLLDRLGIAVSEVPQYVRKDFLPLLDQARSYRSEAQFFQEIAKFKAKSGFVGLIRRLLDEANGASVSDKELWKLLKCLVVLEFDFDTEASHYANISWNRLLDLVPGRTPSVARNVFDTLIAEVDRLAPLAGTVDLQSLLLLIGQRYPELRLDVFDDHRLVGLLQEIRAVFVPPAEYEDALATLQAQNIVCLAGPPHSGKTATALHLALDLKKIDGSRHITLVGPDDDLDLAALPPNSIVILDDFFGDVHLQHPSRVGEISELQRLSAAYSVILTTRESVALEAKRATRLGEGRQYESWTINLSQEGSYDNRALQQILRKHLDFAASGLVSDADRLSEQQVNIAWNNWYSIIEQLRFPHNIQRLCRAHMHEVAEKSELPQAIDNAKDIERATTIWVESLALPEKWFAFAVAVFPSVGIGTLGSIMRRAASRFSFAQDDPLNLLSKTSAYIVDASRPTFKHPSYREAIIGLMRERYAMQVAEIVDQGLDDIARSDVLALIRCTAADYGWVRYTPGEQVDIVRYLERLLSTYNAVRNNVLSSAKLQLDSYTVEDASCLLLISTDGRQAVLMIVPSDRQGAKVYVERPENIAARLSEVKEQLASDTTSFMVYHVTADDLVQRSPHLHGLDIIKRNMLRNLKKQRLIEAWPVSYVRIERSLKKLGSGFVRLDAGPGQPLERSDLENLYIAFENLARGPAPSGILPAAWQRIQVNLAHHLIAIDRSLSVLESHGRKYTGHLLPQPDQPGNGRSIYSAYSTPQMEALIRQGLQLLFESYDYMVEANFASVRRVTEWPHRTDCRVVAATTGSNNLLGYHCYFYFMPPSFETVGGVPYEVYVAEDQKNVDELSAFPPDIQRRLDDIQTSRDWLQMNWGTLRTFLHTEEFIKTIYDWLDKDLERAMRWKDLGQERSRQMATDAQRFAAENPRVHAAWDFTEEVPAFEWPS